MKLKNLTFELTALNYLFFFAFLASVEVANSYAQDKIRKNMNIIEVLSDYQSEISQKLILLKGEANEFYPKLDGARGTYIVTFLVNNLEKEFPGVCDLKTKEDRMEFLNVPSKLLMSPEQFNEFVERSCDLRLYFVAGKNVFLFVTASQDGSGSLRYFGKNIAFQKVKSSGGFDEFVTNADLLANEFSRSK